MKYVKEIKIIDLQKNIDRLAARRAELAVEIERLNKELSALAPRPNFNRAARVRLQKTLVMGDTLDTVVKLK